MVPLGAGVLCRAKALGLWLQPVPLHTGLPGTWLPGDGCQQLPLCQTVCQRMLLICEPHICNTIYRLFSNNKHALTYIFFIPVTVCHHKLIILRGYLSFLFFAKSKGSHSFYYFIGFLIFDL